MYFFRKTNIVRRFTRIVSKNKWFDNAITLVIVCSSIKLCVDTYYLNDTSTNTVVYISGILDYVFNIIFLLECTFKVISLGFV